MKRIDFMRGLTFAVLAIFAVFANAESDEIVQARQALASFQEKDAGIAEFVDRSAGYVVFPMIEKGALTARAYCSKAIRPSARRPSAKPQRACRSARRCIARLCFLRLRTT